jgi:hypothetical protein
MTCPYYVKRGRAHWFACATGTFAVWGEFQDFGAQITGTRIQDAISGTGAFVQRYCPHQVFELGDKGGHRRLHALVQRSKRARHPSDNSVERLFLHPWIGNL